MRKRIYYEHPLNERIRSFLRLEFLFKQVDYSINGTSVWNSRAALETILEIQNLVGRSDLKTEILKELERHTQSLARLQKNPQVDHARLNVVLDELDRLIDLIFTNNQPFGIELKLNEFLNMIRQRTSVPGGTCEFDLPGYHQWLQRPSEERIRCLTQWLDSFSVLQTAILLILKLIRESASPHWELAENGFFQRNLDPNNPCQILRIALPSEVDYFPEISAGKHRFTIRFLRQEQYDNRPQQVHEDVEFELACCIL